MIAAIVDQKDLNSHFMVDNGLQLLDIHLDASVTSYQYHIFPFPGSAHAVSTVFSGGGPDTDRCRKIISHGRHC